MFKRVERGFSLTEMLVVIVISGLVLTGIASAMVANSKVMGQQSSKLGQLVLAEDIRYEISNVDLCTKNLAEPTKSLSLGQDGRAKMKVRFSNGVEVKSNEFNPAYSLRIDHLDFISNSPPTDLGAGRLAYLGDLELSTSGDSHPHRPTLLGKLELIVRSNGSIESCRGASDDVAQLCDSVGGEMVGAKCKLPDVKCVENIRNVTWCAGSCSKAFVKVGMNPTTGEEWIFLNQVGGPVKNSGCPKAKEMVTCRFQVKCHKGSFPTKS